MFGAFIDPISSAIAVAIAEQEAFERRCNGLPKKEADKLRKARSNRFRLAEIQRNRIAVAKAGRSRNFWGTY